MMIAISLGMSSRSLLEHSINVDEDVAYRSISDHSFSKVASETI